MIGLMNTRQKTILLASALIFMMASMAYSQNEDPYVVKTKTGCVKGGDDGLSRNTIRSGGAFHASNPRPTVGGSENLRPLGTTGHADDPWT